MTDSDEKDARKVRELYDALMNLSRKCDEMSSDDQLNEVEEAVFDSQAAAYCNAAQMVKERLMRDD